MAIFERLSPDRVEGVNGYNPYTSSRSVLNSVNLRAGVRHGSWDISAYVSNMLNSRAYIYYHRAQADQGMADAP
jgi:hypothetical protein